MESPRFKKVRQINNGIQNALRAAAVVGTSLIAAYNPALANEVQKEDKNKIEAADSDYARIAELYPALRDALLQKSMNNTVKELEKIQEQVSEKDFTRIIDVLPKSVTYALSVLSHGSLESIDTSFDPAGDLLKDPSLTHLSEINRKFVLSLAREHAAPPEEKDPISSVKLMNAVVEHLSAQYAGKDAFEVEDAASYVARNLFTQGVPVSDDAVKTEVERILKVRESLKDTNIFGNDIVVISFDEKYLAPNEGEEGGERWGTSEFMQKLRERQIAFGSEGTSLEHFRKTDAMTAEVAKKAALNTIAASLRPLTIYHDGHGNSQAIYLSASGIFESNKPTVRITVSEFADALIARHKAQLNLPETERPDITIISAACTVQNFLRAVAEKLREAQVPVPKLMITSSEYGLSGYTDDNEMGSKFNKLITTSPTLESIFHYKKGTVHTNPSVFTRDPSDKYRLMQISGIVTPDIREIA